MKKNSLLLIAAFLTGIMTSACYGQINREKEEFTAGFVKSTKKLSIHFIPMWENKPVALDSMYYLDSGDSLQLDNIKFYVSKVVLRNKGEVVFAESNSFHLIDISDSLSLQRHLSEVPSFDEIQFDLGIDSLTNVSGAMGGDLDPTKGMYWTWQSGYINTKIEGRSTACPTRKHQFQYHIGGYIAPNQTVQRVSLLVEKDTNTISVGIAMKKFFQLLDLKTQHSLMIPCKEAKTLANYFADIFFIQNK